MVSVTICEKASLPLPLLEKRRLRGFRMEMEGSHGAPRMMLARRGRGDEVGLCRGVSHTHTEQCTHASQGLNPQCPRRSQVTETHPSFLPYPAVPGWLAATAPPWEISRAE